MAYSKVPLFCIHCSQSFLHCLMWFYYLAFTQVNWTGLAFLRTSNFPGLWIKWVLTFPSTTSSPSLQERQNLKNPQHVSTFKPKLGTNTLTKLHGPEWQRIQSKILQFLLTRPHGSELERTQAPPILKEVSGCRQVEKWTKWVEKK